MIGREETEKVAASIAAAGPREDNVQTFFSKLAKYLASQPSADASTVTVDYSNLRVEIQAKSAGLSIPSIPNILLSALAVRPHQYCEALSQTVSEGFGSFGFEQSVSLLGNTHQCMFPRHGR